MKVAGVLEEVDPKRETEHCRHGGEEDQRSPNTPCFRRDLLDGHEHSDNAQPRNRFEGKEQRHEAREKIESVFLSDHGPDGERRDEVSIGGLVKVARPPDKPDAGDGDGHKNEGRNGLFLGKHAANGETEQEHRDQIERK